MTTRLSKLFVGVAFKRLRATEVDPATSHGHEFQGVQAFRAILGSDRRELDADFVYLRDDADPVAQRGTLTWYDARENKPARSAEYRLYYSADVSIVQELAEPGDMVVVGVGHDGRSSIIMAQRGSSWEQQVKWLFSLPAEQSDVFRQNDANAMDVRELGLAARLLLDSLGLEPPMADGPIDADAVRTEFPDGFPSTRNMSDFVRRSVKGVDPKDDPDAALVKWLDAEVQAFTVLEQRHWETVKAQPENLATLDSFLELSKSFINRRKSRAGGAFENHLEATFAANGIRYSRGQVTEQKKRPDFLFPSAEDYRNPSFPSARLTVLGAKISCRDRWRQVTTEAARVALKHLATLEPAISEDQTAEMKSESVHLVVPASIRASYTITQQSWVLTIGDFIQYVRTRQSAT